LDSEIPGCVPGFRSMFRLIRSPRSGPAKDSHSFGGKILTAVTCKIALRINHTKTHIGTNAKPRTPRNHGVATPRNVLIKETERRYAGLTAKDVLQRGQGNQAMTRINCLLTRSPHLTHLVLSSRTPSNKFTIRSLLLTLESRVPRPFALTELWVPHTSRRSCFSCSASQRRVGIFTLRSSPGPKHRQGQHSSR
jgi:hypothetical protein